MFERAPEETGQADLELLLKEKGNPIFDQWEKGFISQLTNRKYSYLSKHEKAVVRRLVGWLKGN